MTNDQFERLLAEIRACRPNNTTICLFLLIISTHTCNLGATP